MTRTVDDVIADWTENPEAFCGATIFSDRELILAEVAHTERALKAVEALKALGFTEEGDVA